MKNVNKWSLDDVKAIVNRVSELDENYHKTQSHRQPYTKIVIKSIK